MICLAKDLSIQKRLHYINSLTEYDIDSSAISLNKKDLYDLVNSNRLVNQKELYARQIKALHKKYEKSAKTLTVDSVKEQILETASKLSSKAKLKGIELFDNNFFHKLNENLEKDIVNLPVNTFNRKYLAKLDILNKLILKISNYADKKTEAGRVSISSNDKALKFFKDSIIFSDPGSEDVFVNVDFVRFLEDLLKIETSALDLESYVSKKYQKIKIQIPANNYDIVPFAHEHKIELEDQPQDISLKFIDNELKLHEKADNLKNLFRSYINVELLFDKETGLVKINSDDSFMYVSDRFKNQHDLESNKISLATKLAIKNQSEKDLLVIYLKSIITSHLTLARLINPTVSKANLISAGAELNPMKITRIKKDNSKKVKLYTNSNYCEYLSPKIERLKNKIN